MHLLLKANFKKKKWRDITVEKGEFISSYKHLAKDTGLSFQQVKTAVNHLVKTGEIKTRSTNKYTVFAITNYLKYQHTRTIDDGGIIYDSPFGEDWDELDEDIGDGFDDWEDESEERKLIDKHLNNPRIVTAKELFKKTKPHQDTFN